jgi:hypothetical protein
MIRLYGFENTLCRERFPNGPFGERTLLEMYHARPVLLTVFSTTQSDHLKTLLSSHDITDLEMLRGIHVGYLTLVSR